MPMDNAGRGASRSRVSSLDSRDAASVSQTGAQVTQTLPVQTRVFWKKQVNFHPLPPAPDHEELRLIALNLPPQDYVSKYIPEDIFNVITDQTNRTYVEKKGRPLISNSEQTKKFFGSCIKMSIMGLPRARMYYDVRTKVHAISSILPRDLFFAIRNNLKVVYDNDVPLAERESTKFWKVNPLIKSVRTGCLLNSRTKKVAIDEQMVPFWGRCPARQVIKSKPNPCGIKIFVAAAPDGLPLDFLIYNGKGDLIVDDPMFSRLNIGGKSVIKLLSTFPRGISVYMDRYFTSEELLDLLHSEREATGTGTLQKMRIPSNSKLKEDKIMKREGRGSIDQSVRSDGQISLVKWFDNKAVLLISSKEGVEPLDKCRRWCRKNRVFIEVDRPLVVKEYNINMGGVDFLDRLISYYRISARTRKWTVRLIMHFFDFAIAAGWIEYRRHQRSLGTPKKDVLDLMNFKEEYAEFLIHGHKVVEEDSDPDYVCTIPPPRKQPRVAHPPDALRTKNILHIPEIPTPAKKNRCRFPGCGSNGARVQCSTCKVYLCLQENRNCFKAYHNL